MKGDRLVFHDRMLEVVEENEKIVTYLDCYMDGYVAERRCSRIQWDLDLEHGLLIPVERGENDTDKDIRV